MPRSTASGGAASPVLGIIPEPTNVRSAAAEPPQAEARERHWLLGILITALFHRRTRAPRPS